jgi:hypothetical protein
MSTFYVPQGIKKLEYALYKALLAFILYSNSILCAFKSMLHIHYMANAHGLLGEDFMSYMAMILALLEMDGIV